MSSKTSIVHVPTVKDAFSNHPGHGDAAKTVAAFEKLIVKNQSYFPSTAQQERLDHVAKARGRS